MTGNRLLINGGSSGSEDLRDVYVLDHEVLQWRKLDVQEGVGSAYHHHFLILSYHTIAVINNTLWNYGATKVNFDLNLQALDLCKLTQRMHPFPTYTHAHTKNTHT